MQTENSTLISYGAEGYRWPDNRAHIAFNTLVNDRSARRRVHRDSFRPRRGLDLEQHTGGTRRARRQGARRWSKATLRRAPSDFADPSSSTTGFVSAARSCGTAGPPSAFGREDRPTSEYRHVADSDELDGLTDLTPLSPGAFQRLAR